MKSFRYSGTLGIVYHYDSWLEQRHRERTYPFINASQYLVAKAFLGVPVTVSLGSNVKVLAETRLLTRTGVTAGCRIIMARARMMCLPVDSVVGQTVLASC